MVPDMKNALFSCAFQKKVVPLQPETDKNVQKQHSK